MLREILDLATALNIDAPRQQLDHAGLLPPLPGRWIMPPDGRQEVRCRARAFDNELPAVERFTPAGDEQIGGRAVNDRLECDRRIGDEAICVRPEEVIVIGGSNPLTTGHVSQQQRNLPPRRMTSLGRVLPNAGEVIPMPAAIGGLVGERQMPVQLHRRSTNAEDGEFHIILRRDSAAGMLNTAPSGFRPQYALRRPWRYNRPSRAILKRGFTNA